MLCKLVNGQLKVASGRILVCGDLIISNPREVDFINAGYKPVEDNRLEDKEGYYQVPEYTEEEDKIVVTYHYEEIADDETI